jgi:hypothetical protein
MSGAGGLLSGGGGAAAAGGAATGGGILAGVGGAIKAGGSAVMSGASALGGMLKTGGAALLSNPIGWAVLGAGALAAIFGGGREKTSKSAGMLAVNDPAFENKYKFAVDPFQSGFQPIGFSRGMDRQIGIDAINVFREVDAMIAGPAAKAGLSPNLDILKRSGFAANGTGYGPFFGAANFQGRPGEELSVQIDRYVRGLIQSYSAQLDPDAYSGLMSIKDIGELVEAWRDMFPSYATGLDFAGSDHTANIHKGEAVITAQGNQALAIMATMLADIRDALAGNNPQRAAQINEQAALQFAQSVAQFGRMAEVTP